MVAAAVHADPVMRYSADELREKAARKSLRSFTRRMFPAYQVARHINELVEMLEWAVETPGARLIVTLPPRHSKSLHVSENLPAWYLGRFPDNRVIGASHTQRLANTFSRRVRNKIAHPNYPFAGVAIAGDKGAVEAWDIEERLGGYFAVGVGGSPAGIGANLIVIDDPIKNAESADSEVFREALWEWYREDIRTRLEPGGSIIVTATRWHEDDLTGRLLTAQAQDGEKWRHVHMPAISDEGNALWPERWSLEALEKLRGAVGQRGFDALYQGRPAPADGGMLKRWWWRFWHYEGQPLPPVSVKGPGGTMVACSVVPLPAKFEDSLQSWDMSFKETKSGSFVVGQAWGKQKADRFLLDQYRARTDFPGAIGGVRSLSARFPFIVTKLVENKANGPAVVATLKSELEGLVEVEPEGGKESRAAAASKVAESGNVYLPHPDVAPWVSKFIEECAGFPFGSNDDQVDAFSQAQIRFDSQRIPPSAAPRGVANRSDWR